MKKDGQLRCGLRGFSRSAINRNQSMGENGASRSATNRNIVPMSATGQNQENELAFPNNKMDVQSLPTDNALPLRFRSRNHSHVLCPIHSTCHRRLGFGIASDYPHETPTRPFVAADAVFSEPFSFEFSSPTGRGRIISSSELLSKSCVEKP